MNELSAEGLKNMGRTAIHLHAVVQHGGKIELDAPPGMQEGDKLEVVLLADDRATVGPPARSILDILDSLPCNIGMFKSAEEADAYLRNERDSWGQ
ncbi:MAG TPA: hypothetical protein VFE47_02120 [Tepidisphaeraceae bacterium]|nr:hypothetical protein [Tepidisphaeraceae bacterium]